MPSCCNNCKFFEPYPRKIRYPKGKCTKQFAYRIPDKYKIYLDIMTPYEFICDMYEENPQPVYVVQDGETYLVPPIVAQELISKGWVIVRTSSDKNVIEKGENNDT